MLQALDVNGLLGSGGGYGSFRVLGNLSVKINGISTYTDYNRTLDLTTGVHTTSFKLSSGSHYKTSVFCSYPDQVCVYRTESNAALPAISISLENTLVSSSLLQVSCSGGATRLTGYTRSPRSGMKYDAVAKLASDGGSTCSSGTLVAPESLQTQSVTVVVAAGTDYDQTKGDMASNYSFRGSDPAPLVEATASRAASKSFEQLLAQHTKDYAELQGRFSLTLPDTSASSGVETSSLISRYGAADKGDPLLEVTLFDYCRHLLISSSRKNSLPANLQGRWTERLDPSWNSDYHANINLQMNYWASAQTGLDDPEEALWSYIENTWVPKGTETAKLLYDASGFVVHDEINIFGYTGMKNTAQWANCEYRYT